MTRLGLIVGARLRSVAHDRLPPSNLSLATHCVTALLKTRHLFDLRSPSTSQLSLLQLF